MNAPDVTDWFRLVWDMVQRDFNLAAIERRTGIASSTLRGYLEGSQPPHWRGELLIDTWCEVCGRRRDEVPKAPLSLAPRVVRPKSGPRTDLVPAVELELAWRAAMGRSGQVDAGEVDVDGRI